MNSREKGKRGEIEGAHFLTRLLKIPIRRGQQYRGGEDSPDLLGTGSIHFEVKRQERLNLDRALEQAARDASTSDVPCVLHRCNRKKWKFSFYGDDLLRFVDAVAELIDRGHFSGPPSDGPRSETRAKAKTIKEEEKA